MSGLFARMKPAGRDGVRYARSKHIGDIRDASVIYGSSRVSTDRSFHLLRPASSWAIRRAISTGTPISDQMGAAVSGRIDKPPEKNQRQGVPVELLAKARGQNLTGLPPWRQVAPGGGLGPALLYSTQHSGGA